MGGQATPTNGGRGGTSILSLGEVDAADAMPFDFLRHKIDFLFDFWTKMVFFHFGVKNQFPAQIFIFVSIFGPTHPTNLPRRIPPRWDPLPLGWCLPADDRAAGGGWRHSVAAVRECVCGGGGSGK